jgi:hypothetical protein
MNVTAVDPSGWGFLTVYPCGSVPDASSLNYVAGDSAVANEVIAKLSGSGTVCVYSYAETDLLIDVVGYVASSTAPPPPPPPPPPAEPAKSELSLPPPSAPKSMALLDYIERNFISSKEAHKENLVGCSGVGQSVLWQVREAWADRQHPAADAMMYVIGGEGSLRMDDKDVNLAAGSFAVVPRGTSYGFTRRGRNPLIVLAFLAGAPCAGN